MTYPHLKSVHTWCQICPRCKCVQVIVSSIENVIGKHLKCPDCGAPTKKGLHSIPDGVLAVADEKVIVPTFEIASCPTIDLNLCVAIATQMRIDRAKRCGYLVIEDEQPSYLVGVHATEIIGIGIYNAAAIHISQLHGLYCLRISDEEPWEEHPALVRYSVTTKDGFGNVGLGIIDPTKIGSPDGTMQVWAERDE